MALATAAITPTSRDMTAVRKARPKKFTGYEFLPAWQMSNARPVAKRDPHLKAEGQCTTKLTTVERRGPAQKAAVRAVAATWQATIP